jgi:acetyl-CoA acyltransferase
VNGLDGGRACILDAVRTPVGRGHPEKGIYRDVHPADLLGRTFRGLVQHSGIDAAEVESLVAGCVYQIGEQSSGIGRNAWLQEGLPETTAATTVDIRCGSGQQAVHYAALQILAGMDEVVVAGGVEHMGRLGFRANLQTREAWGQPFTDELLARHALVSQGEAAELIADLHGIERDEMDALSLVSHQRAAAARASGSFDREILPIHAGGTVHRSDQGIRDDTSADALAGLRAAFREGGRVTAGNASQVSDGAAALLLASPAKAAELGLRPRAEIVDQVVVGVDPVTMLTGPIPATERILRRNGLSIGDVDLVEINEAFASVVIAWQRALGADMERVNVRGGAIALGHPLGASGARLLTTLLHALEDEDRELGLATMCCAGGLGTATLIRRV